MSFIKRVTGPGVTERAGSEHCGHPGVVPGDSGSVHRMTDDCYLCGDGVEIVNGEWQHCEDLGIDIDGCVVVTTCEWGRTDAVH